MWSPIFSWTWGHSFPSNVCTTYDYYRYTYRNTSTVHIPHTRSNTHTYACAVTHSLSTWYTSVKLIYTSIYLASINLFAGKIQLISAELNGQWLFAWLCLWVFVQGCEFVSVLFFSFWLWLICGRSAIFFLFITEIMPQIGAVTDHCQSLRHTHVIECLALMWKWTSHA